MPKGLAYTPDRDTKLCSSNVLASEHPSMGTYDESSEYFKGKLVKLFNDQMPDEEKRLGCALNNQWQNIQRNTSKWIVAHSRVI